MEGRQSVVSVRPEVLAQTNQHLKVEVMSSCRFHTSARFVRKMLQLTWHYSCHVVIMEG